MLQPKFTKKYHGNFSNSGMLDLIGHTLDLQFKNQFDAIILDDPETLLGSGDLVNKDRLLSAGGSIVDTVMARVFLYSIEIPSYGYEFRRMGGNQHVVNAIYPETVTLTFLEDTYGITRRYIQYWMAKVATPHEFKYAGGVGNNRVYRGRIFRENQRQTKKNMIVLLSGYENIPLYPRIMLYGLKPKSIGDVTVGHEEKEYMKLTLTCSVDEIKVPWLI